MHTLEAVLREEQVAADHRRDGHRHHDNEKGGLEAAKHPQNGDQGTVAQQHQQRIPVTPGIPKKRQQRDTEKEYGEVAE